jgi:hypothetical protein
MLKNKTKEQLLELLYQTNNENYNLQLTADKQAEILKSISKAYHPSGFFARLFNFFALPFKILQILRAQNEYFYLIELSKMNLTREQIVEANKAILDFENKRVSTDEYKAYVISMLGLPAQCSSCSDVSGRLHDDFQKRVIAEMVAKYPDLLPTPPTFKSGQFCGDTYKKWAQTYHFKGLLGLLSNMKTSALNAKSRGALEQSKLMLEDCEALKAFIEARKAGQNEIEETTGVVDLGVEAIEGDLETFDLPDEEIKDFVNKGENGVLSEVLETKSDKFADELGDNWEESKEETTTEAAKEKKVYTNEEAALLKTRGMTLAELGVYYGVDTSTIKRRLDKYEAVLAAVDKSDEVL